MVALRLSPAERAALKQEVDRRRRAALNLDADGRPVLCASPRADGNPCSLWAVRGHHYCAAHLRQAARPPSEKPLRRTAR